MANKALPVAAAAATGMALLAVTGIALVATSSSNNAGSANPNPAPAVPPPPITWLGGLSRANIDALAFMLASENPSKSTLLWALQAIAANNWAKILRHAKLPINSIADMLRSGVIKKTKKRLYNLPWGRQFDQQTKIVRWAATSAGATPLNVKMHFYEMAERLLANRIDLQSLRGRKGEQLPNGEVLARIHSFLQYEGFGETVQRQTGSDEPADVETVLADWGNPSVLAEVDGVRFYGRR